MRQLANQRQPVGAVPTTCAHPAGHGCCQPTDRASHPFFSEMQMPDGLFEHLTILSYHVEHDMLDSEVTQVRREIAAASRNARQSVYQSRLDC